MKPMLDMEFMATGNDFAHEKRWRATALHNAVAIYVVNRAARSVLECARPPALWRRVRNAGHHYKGDERRMQHFVPPPDRPSDPQDA